MVQIGSRRKKKGRPPATPTKLDLDRRGELSCREDDVPQRRSTRRRNITYNEDFYDEIFEEEEEDQDDNEDEDEEEDLDLRRREKKVKSVMKIPDKKVLPTCKRVNSVNSLSRTGGGGGRRRNENMSSSSSSSSSSDEDNHNTNNKYKPFKKRKISVEDEEDDNESSGDDEDVKSFRSKDQKKCAKPNGVAKKLDSVQHQGKMSDSSKGVPLPERQQLEFILDKLQKKDTYGVYGEPVDPDELPDYHDVIEHPMDFGTVRKKLAKGSYSKLEQFENDIDLICTNAMQYNAPETIYFKQARSIQDLARKKFERLKTEIQDTVAELKSEETIKTNSIIKKPEYKSEEIIKPNPIIKKPDFKSEESSKTNSIIKKPIRKPPCKIIQEPVGSDFSSGATLAAAADIYTLSNATPSRGYEKPTTAADVHVDVNSSLTESKPEKVEEQISGKGFPSKLGRKPFVVDENRRATYNISNQPTESMCTIFQDEKPQLVSVGLHADHAYARSLARFAATLGPVAWKIAAQRIERALPEDIKFGRGWVGDYEPLPTPVLMLENRPQKQLRPGLSFKSTKDDKAKEDMKVQACEPRSTPVQMITTQTQWRPGLPSKSTKDEKAKVDMMRVQVCEPQPTPAQTIENQAQWRPRNSPQARMIQDQTERRPDNSLPASLIENQTHWRPGNSSKVPMVENQTRWQPGNSLQGKIESPKEKFAEVSKLPKNDVHVGRISDSSALAASTTKLQDRANERHFTNPILEEKAGFMAVASGSKSFGNSPYQPQSSLTMNNGGSDITVLKQVQSNRSSPASGIIQGHVLSKQFERNPEVTTSRLLDVVSRNQNLVQSVPFKHSDVNGFVGGRTPNGSAGINSSNHQSNTISMPMPMPYTVGSNQQVRAATYFPQANQEQGLSDPVQMMKMLAQKTQNQQKSFNFPGTDGGQNMTPDALLRRDDPNAAAAAARAWMTLGATQFKTPDGPGSPKLQIAASSLYNNTGREVPQTIPQNREEAFLSRGQLQSKNDSFPPQIFLPQQNRAGNEVPIQNNRQMVFPQLVTTDLSRFQGQTPWQGLRPHTQPNKKQDSFPPDLNISFQSSSSPRQSAGAMVDSQQPDLALQL